MTTTGNPFASFGGFTIICAVLAVTTEWLLLLARTQPSTEDDPGEARDAS